MVVVAVARVTSAGGGVRGRSTAAMRREIDVVDDDDGLAVCSCGSASSSSSINFTLEEDGRGAGASGCSGCDSAVHARSAEAVGGAGATGCGGGCGRMAVAEGGRTAVPVQRSDCRIHVRNVKHEVVARRAPY